MYISCFFRLPRIVSESPADCVVAVVIGHIKTKGLNRFRKNLKDKNLPQIKHLSRKLLNWLHSPYVFHSSVNLIFRPFLCLSISSRHNLHCCNISRSFWEIVLLVSISFQFFYQNLKSRSSFTWGFLKIPFA